jgi:hypothetical protein
MSKRLSSFVEERLGVSFHETDHGILNLQDLVGLSIRRNPKRAHLLVSEVLGKHIPQNPEVISFAGRILGAMVANVLSGRDQNEYLTRALTALKSYLDTGEWDTNSTNFVNHLPKNVRRVVSIGYAETATSLGFLVAEQIDSWYIHSTRCFDETTVPYGNFEEAHSHATSHQLIPASRALLDSGTPVVLIDDEMSTGKTVINTITELHGISPHSEYVVASLIDCRHEEDRQRMQDFADSLGVKLTVVALATGEVAVPSGATDVAASIIEESAVTDLSHSSVHYSPALDSHPGVVTYVSVHSEKPVVSRFGINPAEYLPGHAEKVAKAIGPKDGKTVVLGLEEFMYFPLQVAEELSKISSTGQDVFSSSTTQSPVAVIERDDYAVSNGIGFISRQNDEELQRFAYNVVGRFDRIIVVLEPGFGVKTIMGYNGLIEILQKITPEIIIVNIEKEL